MRKLDIYILRKFMGTFVYALGIIILIVIIFDFSEKLDAFIIHHAPLHAIIFDYYLNFIPYFANLFSPLFTFVAVIFFTSRLAARSEIIAMLSAGVSFNRIMVPYMIGSGLIASMSLYLNHIVIPDANKTRIRFEDTYVRDQYYNLSVHIHKQIGPGVFIYLHNFDVTQNLGIKFALEHITNNQIHYKMMSETIKWDSTKHDWRVYNYFTRKILPDGKEIITSGMEKDTTLGFLPSDFREQLIDVQAMNYKELNAYIAMRRMEGSNNLKFFEIERDQRTAFPFATFILTIIGVSLSSRKIRGGTGMHLGLGLLLAFSFILFMKISTTFAESGFLSPLVAVWVPNIIYGILAIFLYQNSGQVAGPRLKRWLQIRTTGLRS
jgi:lipopolysaccharide export system permease protein